MDYDEEKVDLMRRVSRSVERRSWQIKSRRTNISTINADHMDFLPINPQYLFHLQTIFLTRKI